MRRQYPDARIFGNVFEGVFYRCLVGVAAIGEFEAEVAAFRIDLRQIGHRRGQRDDAFDLPEAPQVTQDGDRVEADAQNPDVEAGGNVPEFGAGILPVIVAPTLDLDFAIDSLVLLSPCPPGSGASQLRNCSASFSLSRWISASGSLLAATWSSMRPR